MGRLWVVFAFSHSLFFFFFFFWKAGGRGSLFFGSFKIWTSLVSGPRSSNGLSSIDPLRRLLRRIQDQRDVWQTRAAHPRHAQGRTPLADESGRLHTVWCNVPSEAAGEIWNWSLLGVKRSSGAGCQPNINGGYIAPLLLFFLPLRRSTSPTQLPMTWCFTGPANQQTAQPAMESSAGAPRFDLRFHSIYPRSVWSCWVLEAYIRY